VGSAGLGVGEPSSLIRLRLERDRPGKQCSMPMAWMQALATPTGLMGLMHPPNRWGLCWWGRETGSCTTAWRAVHSLSGTSSRQDARVGRGVNPARGRGLLDAWRECFGSLLNSDGSPAASGLPSSCPGFWVSSYWHRAPGREVAGAVTATMLWPLRHCGGVMA